jgi:TDG/mug DNA glycosylase family protein
MGTAPHVLPDVLPCGLRAVICGTAVGDLSYRRKAYYADYRNCFWDALREVGLTPHTLKAEDFLTLPTYGLGLTDIAKFEFGTDVTLRMEAFGVPTFIAKMRLCRPNIVAFNGKNAARIFYGFSTNAIMGYGPGPPIENFPQIFVLPSTAGAARRFWNLEWWQKFARLVKED